MANGFRVNEKKRIVTVYRLSMAENDFTIIDKYKSMGYIVDMKEKKEPPKKTGIKGEDLIKYLDNGNIPQVIYNEMKERLQKKQNFLRVKSWLITALKDYADEHKTEYAPIADIIKTAKEKENLTNAQREEQTMSKGNKEKSKVIEIQQDTSKNK